MRFALALVVIVTLICARRAVAQDCATIPECAARRAGDLAQQRVFERATAEVARVTSEARATDIAYNRAIQRTATSISLEATIAARPTLTPLPTLTTIPANTTTPLPPTLTPLPTATTQPTATPAPLIEKPKPVGSAPYIVVFGALALIVVGIVALLIGKRTVTPNE